MGLVYVQVELKANQSWFTVCEVLGSLKTPEGALWKHTGISLWTKVVDQQTNIAVSCLCSEPDNVSLVGGGSRCTDRLEMRLQDDWKTFNGSKGDHKSAALVCSLMKSACCFNQNKAFCSKMCVGDHFFQISNWTCTDGATVKTKCSGNIFSNSTHWCILS